MEADVRRNEDYINGELYFLIAKFLSIGPCKNSAETLKKELERAKILPQRLDWLGNKHDQSFSELESKHSNIGSQHLFELCLRIVPELAKEASLCSSGTLTLLQGTKSSLLRTKQDSQPFVKSITNYTVRNGGKPLIPSSELHVPNLVKVLQGRENSGPLTRQQAVPTAFYSKFQLYRRTLGHLSAVYCVLFDRTGKYVITGADDLLVKVWSSTDGRLLATFRGASSEIMDIAVNFDNTLLAAGSLDRILRIWCFQTMSPVAVLSGHSGMITSINFCPIIVHGMNYLVSTSSDGSVAFWMHTKEEGRYVFQPKPIQYQEKMRPGQAQMICASFSPGGAFIAAGSADHHVRVYRMVTTEGPKRVLEVEAHSDTVDSIQWAHTGLKFISGSKDGTAIIWTFDSQQWERQILLMSTKLPGEEESEDVSKRKVTMVCWDASDEWIITATNDSALRVWNSKTGELVRILKEHKDEVFVLEAHPIDPRVIMSAGHDGQLIVWDVLKTQPIGCFQNFIEGQGNGAIFDAKWSPDGTKIVATDSHGHLMMYGFGGDTEKLKSIPKELFFHTDYRPLIRDGNHYVLDEQTQTAPHLMPPPFLVDIDGNPYPPSIQRLVPGREYCHSDQLVPNTGVGANGAREVIEGGPQEQPRSNIDIMIEQLAQRRNIVDNANNEEEEVDVVEARDDEPLANLQNYRQQVQIQGANRVANDAARNSDTPGVRQSFGNWQRDNTTPWNRPILARPLDPAVLETQYQRTNALAQKENERYTSVMEKKTPVVAPALPQETNKSVKQSKKNQARHGYRTRATRADEPDEDEDFENDPSDVSSNDSSNESMNEDEMISESSSSESSEYSDWIADHGEVLEPPKRSKRKPVQKRTDTPPSDNGRKKNRRSPQKKVSMPVGDRTTVSEAYKPSEWLSEVIPRKAPYYPQMGDEIVYFRQGHEKYLEAVKSRNIYQPNNSFEPWRKLNLKAHEYCKIVGIKYEIRPPRLCCLKVAQTDEDGHLTGVTFQIKYHDLVHVLDFLVLRQTFDKANQRKWSEGHRFRCMIEDGWWTGQIVSVQPFSEDFPDSFFLCFYVRWDTGEMEHLSPWDLEPIDETRLPDDVNGAVPILPEELQEIQYQPQPEEWPMGDRESACRRIIRGLDQVMALAIAEPFIAPVDLSIYPTYAYVIEYPIDLSTIKSRFENRFYRRIASAQFDVRFIANNAEKFNERHSEIVKKARMVTELCLKILKEVNDVDVMSVYHQISDTYQSTSSESEADVSIDINTPSTSSHRIGPRRNISSGRRHKEVNFDKDWRKACRQLLEMLWQSPDSEPFREPVDPIEHPNYNQIVDTPMDLGSVKEDLFGDNYETPIEFAKDVKLIFTNSKSYNTNTRSKIYAMTVRLSAMFEEYIKKIISRYRSESKVKKETKSTPLKKSGSKKGSPVKNQLSNGTVNSRRRNVISSDDDDNDEEDEELEENDEDLSKPGPSKNSYSTRSKLRPRSSKKRKLNSSEDEDNDDDEDDGDDDDEDDDDQDEEDKQNVSNSNESSSAESEVDNAPRRQTRSCKVSPLVNGKDHHDDTSDEEYSPNTPITKGKQVKRNTRAKTNKKTQPNRTNGRRHLFKDEDDEEEEDYNDYENDGGTTDQTDEGQSRIKKQNVGNKRVRRRATTRNTIPDTSSNEDDDDDDDDDDDEDDEDEIVVKQNNGRYKANMINEDDEYEESEDEQTVNNADEENNRPSTSSSNTSRDSENSSSAGLKRNPRRTGTKRLRYNENTDEDEDHNNDDYGRHINNRTQVNKRQKTRPFYGEHPSDDDSNHLQPNMGISVSSRGRVRKMTPKAMHYALR